MVVTLAGTLIPVTRGVGSHRRRGRAPTSRVADRRHGRNAPAGRGYLRELEEVAPDAEPSGAGLAGFVDTVRAVAGGTTVDGARTPVRSS